MKINRCWELSLFVFALGTLTVIGAETTAAKPDEAVLLPVGTGWMPIFNGTNLDGWAAQTNYWKMDDGGVLHGRTPGTPDHHYAYSNTNYGDFELHADVKLIGNNSG